VTERFKVTPLEANTPLWLAMRAHYERRLHKLRTENDTMTYDATKTAELRGRIAEVKALLNLDKPDKGPQD
jgi:hypothetical protein